MAIACMCPGWDNTQGVDLVSCIIRIIYLLWYNTQRIIAAKRMQGARGRNPQYQTGAPEKRADASDEQKQRVEKYEKIRRDAAIDQEREAEFMCNTDPSKISDDRIVQAMNTQGAGVKGDQRVLLPRRAGGQPRVPLAHRAAPRGARPRK